MSVVLDILRTYRTPKSVQVRRMTGFRREGGLLAMALTACGLIFVAQLPRLARESWSDPTVGLDARLAGAFFAWMVAMPLVLYAIALLVHVVLRLVRWPATGYACRAALFWALLASTPAWLLSGLAAGLAPGLPFDAMSLVAFALFCAFLWAGMLAMKQAHVEAA
ncbi:MAG: YIP1 family protein [Boseongicola sp.]|nr:YIP1 family protein [Boseongicola sp.]MXW85638.1 YIP1 family protein [Boseongicola sp. SB0667_bin_21]